MLSVRKHSIWFVDINCICIGSLKFHLSCVNAYNYHLKRIYGALILQYPIFERMRTNSMVWSGGLSIFRSIRHVFPFFNANAHTHFTQQVSCKFGVHMCVWLLKWKSYEVLHKFLLPKSSLNAIGPQTFHRGAFAWLYYFVVFFLIIEHTVISVSCSNADASFGERTYA